MKQSGLLKRMKQREEISASFSGYTMQQFYLDTAQIAMHRTLGYGYERIKRFTREWEKVRDEYKVALKWKEAECDVAREHMDRELLEIINGKQDLIPFSKRYPGLEEVKY